MLGLTSVRRIYVNRKPTDMRKSFDGICGEVESVLEKDPLSGDLYVFFNKSRRMVKMLLWDRNGFWLFNKRLEQGTFSLNTLSPTGEIDIARLLCILDGIELSGSSNKKRFLLET